MRITFLAHSGFLVELDAAYLLFDWWKGDVPALAPEKPLLVFASHCHSDHFNPELFALDDGRRTVGFLLGNDVRLSPRNRERWRISADTAAKCLVLGGGKTAEPLPGVTVETFPSTDEGVAFLVAAGGKTIFHAGDLNWWHWEGEDRSWNLTMAANFQSYTAPLLNRRIDVAMFPLDPRLGEDGFRGPRYFLEQTDTAVLLPMHQWGDFAFTDRFLAEYPQFAGRILPVLRDGQTFDLD